MPSAIPNPVVEGDIIGHLFPTCEAMYPHPALVIAVVDGVQRQRLLRLRRVPDQPGAQLVTVLMISHSPPAQGESAEEISMVRRAGTQLDQVAKIFACYRHFDTMFVPGQERVIGSVRGPYLGRMEREHYLYFRSQLAAVQRYEKGRSMQRPVGLAT